MPLTPPEPIPGPDTELGKDVLVVAAIPRGDAGGVSIGDEREEPTAAAWSAGGNPLLPTVAGRTLAEAAWVVRRLLSCLLLGPSSLTIGGVKGAASGDG